MQSSNQSINQYMKGKSHKFGYELLELCVDIDFVHKTEIYSGQENNLKFWKTEEPDMGSSGTFVTYYP